MPGDWRTFDVTTRVDLLMPSGATQVWLPLPSVESDWQRSLTNGLRSNGQARLAQDGRYGVKMLHVQFDAGVSQPFVELTSRVSTRNRATDWAKKAAVAAASPRCAAAVTATSRPCWRPATWAASVPT